MAKVDATRSNPMKKCSLRVCLKSHLIIRSGVIIRVVVTSLLITLIFFGN